jgi:hypothetical protein
MNKVIIRQLADVLDNLEIQRFNMSYWISSVERAVTSGDIDWTDEGIHDKYSISTLYRYFYPEEGDDMEIDILKCHTAGCLAGWANALVSNLSCVIRLPTDVVYNANCALGLSDHEGDQLYYTYHNSIWDRYRDTLGLDGDFCMEDIDNKIAAKALRLIADGEIIFLPLSMHPMISR